MAARISLAPWRKRRIAHSPHKSGGLKRRPDRVLSRGTIGRPFVARSSGDSASAITTRVYVGMGHLDLYLLIDFRSRE